MDYDPKQERIVELLRMNAEIWNEKEGVIRMNNKLKSENLDLHDQNFDMAQEIQTMQETLESQSATITKQNKAYNRLKDAMENIVNSLLRQTIAQKSHGERNQQLRSICSSILQILNIADDDYPHEEIPF